MIGPDAEVGHDPSDTVNLMVTAPFIVQRKVVFGESVLERVPPVAVHAYESASPSRSETLEVNVIG